MIHLTRKQSVLLAATLIALFFISMWAISKNSKPAIRNVVNSPLATPTAAASSNNKENAQFLLNEFHRSETKNGRKMWEIKATRGEYFPDKQLTEIYEANVWLFRENGEEVFLQSPKALVTLGAATLSKAFFPETIHVVHNNELTIDTSLATYDKIAETIYSDHPVTVISELIEVRGKKFMAKINENSIVISGGVTTVIKPQKGKK